MGKFRFVDKVSGKVLDEVEMADCHTPEMALGSRYGSSIPPDGVECDQLPDDQVLAAQEEVQHGHEAG